MLFPQPAGSRVQDDDQEDNERGMLTWSIHPKRPSVAGLQRREGLTVNEPKSRRVRAIVKQVVHLGGTVGVLQPTEDLVDIGGPYEQSSSGSLLSADYANLLRALAESATMLRRVLWMLSRIVRSAAISSRVVSGIRRMRSESRSVERDRHSQQAYHRCFVRFPRSPPGTCGSRRVPAHPLRHGQRRRNDR